jgi:hypothetical protein
MKFVERRPFAEPDLAARKLVEIANGVEPVLDGRISSSASTHRSFAAGVTGDDFPRRIQRAIALGWLWRHESGTDVKFTV